MSKLHCYKALSRDIGPSFALVEQRGDLEISSELKLKILTLLHMPSPVKQKIQ